MAPQDAARLFCRFCKALPAGLRKKDSRVFISRPTIRRARAAPPLSPAPYRVPFAADGVSRGLTNSPPDCWLRAAAHRPVRPLTTAIQKNVPRRGTHFSAPAPFRVSFAADGVSRGLTNSPPDCWLRAAARRPVRPLTTAIQKRAPRRYTPGDDFLYAGGGGRTHTVSPPTDFESVSSANSNTPACNS